MRRSALCSGIGSLLLPGLAEGLKGCMWRPDPASITANGLSTSVAAGSRRQNHLPPFATDVDNADSKIFRRPGGKGMVAPVGW